MKKIRHKYNYYRKIKTHQEMVANEATKDDHGREKFGRAKRGKRFLDPWTLEKRHHFENSWKKLSKEQKQYKCYGRGQKHIYIIHPVNFNHYSIEYHFNQYCNRNRIPHKVSKLYIYREKNRYKRCVGIKLIWWSNKDIGIEYILEKSEK